MKTMNKCKIAKRRGMRLLLVKGIKGQQLSEWEFNAINSDEVTGLLHLDARKKGLIYNLEYDITGYIPFLEFLRIPMNREIFARVLDNILENLRSVNEKHFNPQLILYDMDKIYINPSTQRLFFAYVPLQPFENGGSLQQMLRSIIQHGAFDEEEDCAYITEYVGILNNGINFSAFDLEEYAKRLMRAVNGQQDEGTVECPRCHAILPADTVLCNCGFKLRGLTGSTNRAKQQVYDMFHDMDSGRSPENTSLAPEKQTPLPPPEKQTPPPEKQAPPPETERKASGRKQTTVLSLYDQEDPTRAWLIRETSGEKIPLDRFPFRLGRESGDYVVPNRYVSEPHLELRCRSGRFYAVDLDSTNKTYVDAAAIAPRQEREIFSGTRLRLANERFQFITE